MDNPDKENYFSIYMKKKENNNKKKKSISGKTNKTLKTSNFSNLHIPQGQSLKKLVFNSEKKEKNSLFFIKNKCTEKHLKDTITRNKDNIDNDKKIDMLEARIFDILDLIDNFKTQYINKNERISLKEKIKNHFDKANYLNKIEIINNNTETKENKRKKIIYRSISSNNTERKPKIFIINKNINSNINKKRNINKIKIANTNSINSKKNNKNISNKNNNKINNKNINININNYINSNTNKNSKTLFKSLQNSNHHKSNSQLLNSDKKIKETILQRRIDYANLINQKFIKKKKKHLSQSQVFANKNIIFYSPNTKKITSNLYVEIGSDNSSTREISEKVFIGGSKRKKKNKPFICSNFNNKLCGFKFNNFKQLNRINTENIIYKSDSERTKRLTNITKKYKFDFENF